MGYILLFVKICINADLFDPSASVFPILAGPIVCGEEDFCLLAGEFITFRAEIHPVFLYASGYYTTFEATPPSLIGRRVIPAAGA